MRSLFIVLAAALGLNLAGTFAQASCAQQTLAEQSQRADVVAYGRVSGTSFEIFQVLKGQAGGRVQVRFGSGMPGVITSVDYDARPGDHTLYLQRDGAGFATNACSGSHEGPPTAAELAYLGVSGVATSGSAGTGEVSVIGAGLEQTGAIAVALAGLGAVALIALAVLRSLARATA